MLRVEIDDLQAEFDLYNSRSDLRLLTLNANTAPLAWKLLLYGSGYSAAGIPAVDGRSADFQRRRKTG